MDLLGTTSKRECLSIGGQNNNNMSEQNTFDGSPMIIQEIVQESADGKKHLSLAFSDEQFALIFDLGLKVLLTSGMVQIQHAGLPPEIMAAPTEKEVMSEALAEMKPEDLPQA